MSLDAFSEYFGELKDPRQTAKISYPLFDVLFLTVRSVIAGAEGGGHRGCAVGTKHAQRGILSME